MSTYRGGATQRKFNEFVYCDFVLAKAYVQRDEPNYLRYVAFGSMIGAVDSAVKLDKSQSKSPVYIRCRHYLGYCLTTLSADAVAQSEQLFSGSFSSVKRFACKFRKPGLNEYVKGLLHLASLTWSLSDSSLHTCRVTLTLI